MLRRYLGKRFLQRFRHMRPMTKDCFKMIWQRWCRSGFMGSDIKPAVMDLKRSLLRALARYALSC